MDFTRVAFVSWKQMMSAPNLSKNSFRFWFAVLLREALSPFTFHDTIFMIPFTPYELNYCACLDILAPNLLVGVAVKFEAKKLRRLRTCEFFFFSKKCLSFGLIEDDYYS